MPAVRWLARRLAGREAAALISLASVSDCLPRLVSRHRDGICRTWLDGAPLHRGAPPDRAYFRHARRLLRRIHLAGVTHNDLAKEANWLRLPDGRAGLIDFQIATRFDRRGAMFRLLAREDLRHLLKHKRHYLPDSLTARERRMLESPGPVARVWRAAGKPVQRFVSRVVFGLEPRSSAEERGAIPDTD